MPGVDEGQLWASAASPGAVAVMLRLGARAPQALQKAPLHHLVQPPRVVIAGPPNAGKSTLLNRLTRRDLARTSPEAGTTRDHLTHEADLPLPLPGEGNETTQAWHEPQDHTLRVLLHDTPGLRSDAGTVEAEAAALAVGPMRDADVLIHLRAPGQPPVDLPRAADLRCLSHADDPAAARDRRGGELMVSAVTGDGLSGLAGAVCRHLGLHASVLFASG